MTQVVTYSYGHSVTYVTDNILRSFKDIIRLSGLSPAKFAGSWDVYHRGVNSWLSSGHLEKAVLEIYNPKSNELITRWDVEVRQTWSGTGDGSFWTDTEQLKFAIKKAGVAPADATYDLILSLKPNAPSVQGWGSASFRSTEGMVRQSLGTTIEHSGLGASAAYWRRA